MWILALGSTDSAEEQTTKWRDNRLKGDSLFVE